MSDFERIGIAGFGLIGASMAKALKENGFTGEVHAIDIHANPIRVAEKMGWIDGTDIHRADLVVLAMPVGHYGTFFSQYGDRTRTDCLFTDVGSVKLQAHETVSRHLKPGQRFVGGHPMVGSEQSGFRHSKGHLFENAFYFLTDRDGNAEDVGRLKSLIGMLGARSVETTPEEHDRIVARTSHLPHVSAALLVNVLNRKGLIDYVGGGFRDTTRIASGSPELWTDILMNNHAEVIDAIDAFTEMLQEVREAIQEQDDSSLRACLTQARQYREEIPRHLRDAISQTQCVYVDVKDAPGVIAQASGILAEHEISIRDIEIAHAREQMPGVLKIGFYSEEDQLRAAEVLSRSEFGRRNPIHLGGE